MKDNSPTTTPIHDHSTYSKKNLTKFNILTLKKKKKLNEVVIEGIYLNTWTVNFQMFKLVLEKAEETEIKLPTSAGSSKKQESSIKSIYFCFIDYAKNFDCVDHNNLWKILKEMGIPDHLTCLFRNLYSGQEATVRTGHGTTD